MFPAWLSILILSLFASLVMTIIYKYTTDQVFMKSSKEELKKLQTEMKASSKDPKKFMKLQSKAMEINMKYMTQSFKPMIITMIPILVIFGWLIATYSFGGVISNNDFSATVFFKEGATGNVSVEPGNLALVSASTLPASTQTVFTFKGVPEGVYPVKFIYGNESYILDVSVSNDGKKVGTKDVKRQDSIFGISTGSNENRIKKESSIQIISLKLNKYKIFGQDFNLFGWYPGVLAVYLFFSIISSMALRKWMKVY